MVKNDIEKGLFFSIIVTLAAFFPLSVLLGVIRRKNGLPAAMIFHSLNNIIVLSLNSVYVHYGL
jgi:membrane protease YdiL (CAAX protease family)